MRIFFTVIIFIHGFIHLMGFVNQWGIKKFTQFTGVTLFPVSESLSKILGLAWLFTTLLFTAAAIGFLLQKDWWYSAGFAAVVISQLLIIIYWKDARAGTIANIIILGIAVVSFASSNFEKKIDGEVTAMYSNLLEEDKKIITIEMIRELPPVVQKWIKRSGMIGRENINYGRLRQKARMKSKPDGKWMDVEALQYFRLNEPAFVYKISADVAPFVWIVGRDKYDGGRGNMEIKILGLYTIADSKGKEIDEGTIIRFLSEILWFPSAALNKYIEWEQIDDTTAKATMSYSGISESVWVYFTEEGDVKMVEAYRYGEFDGKFSKEKWSVVNTSYKEFHGIRIGNISEVTWKLQTGDFTWLKLEITEMEYNQPHLY